MKLFVFAEPDQAQDTRVAMIKSAASNRDIELVTISQNDNIDYLCDLSPNEHLYFPLFPGLNSKYLSANLILVQKCRSFVRNMTKYALARQRSGISLYLSGIPTPKTFFQVPTEKDELSKILAEIGGLPVIIKVMDGSKGIGTLKFDSLDSLVSFLDYSKSLNIQINLKQYIAVARPVSSYRAIVLGEEVILCYKNQNVSSDDFRSNVDQKQRRRSIHHLSSAESKTIISAVHCMGLNFGGLDFIYDQHEQLKVLEVNFPFNFVPAVEQFGVDIPGMLIDYLLLTKPL